MKSFEKLKLYDAILSIISNKTKGIMLSEYIPSQSKTIHKVYPINIALKYLDNCDIEVRSTKLSRNALYAYICYNKIS